jgi:low temperature requirement protein LtrA
MQRVLPTLAVMTDAAHVKEQEADAHTEPHKVAVARRRRMSGRDIHEAHRVSTPLELLFDLTAVVAVAAAAAQLHHAVAEQHLMSGLVAYVTTFASIWWAWMTYTWFASAYDTDDVGFRVATMVQMVGVLILAAGVPKAAHGDLTLGTLGYVVMRVGLVWLWWRVAREHPDRRRTALRYVVGILSAQTLWVARLALLQVQPALALPSFFLLALLELAVPVWAAKVGHTPWHAHHIAERYGLFTIIVLGECVLGTTTAISSVIESEGWSWGLAGVGAGGVGLILTLWWVYFLVPSAEALHHHRERAFRWGYIHFLVFGSLAALGAFLGVVADQLKGSAAGSAAGAAAAAPHALSPVLVIALAAAAVAIYLATVWSMSAGLTRVQARLAPAWLGALALLVAVVAAVMLGLPLTWAICLLPLAPAIVIVTVELGLRRRPEQYRIG